MCLFLKSVSAFDIVVMNITFLIILHFILALFSLKYTPLNVVSIILVEGLRFKSDHQSYH